MLLFHFVYFCPLGGSRAPQMDKHNPLTYYHLIKLLRKTKPCPLSSAPGRDSGVSGAGGGAFPSVVPPDGGAGECQSSAALSGC